MRLAKDGHVVRHLPSSAFIGRDRMTIFYPGQPKLCHRCGEKGHFSSGCSVVICTLCRGRGHVAKECGQIRCNLCQRLGHPYSQCPDAWHNIIKEVQVEALFDRPSPSVADPSGPVQVPSPAPVVTPSVSVSPSSVSVPMSPQPSVSAPPVSVPSVSAPPVSVPSMSAPPVSVPSESQESVMVSSPPESVSSNMVEDPPVLQGKVCQVGVVEGAKGGAAASSEVRGPGKARAKTKNREVNLSEDDLQYLEGRKGVRRRRGQRAPKQKVVQVTEDPVPVSNRFGVLSDASASEASSENEKDSDMECEGASRKREASGDEQQRGAKKPSL